MVWARYTSDFRLYQKLLRQARPYWLHIGGIFVLGLLSMPLALLMPLPLKIAVDSVIGSKPIPGFLDILLPIAIADSKTAVLAIASVLVVAIALLNQLQGFGSLLLGTYTGEKMVLEFRAQLFRHVQRLSLTYHDSKGTTDSTYRIQYDAPAIQWIMINGFIPLITSVFTFIGMTYVTVRLDWQLAVIALGVSPILFLLTQFYSQRLRRQWTEAKDLESSALSVVQEVLGAIRVVKAFGRETHEQDRFIDHYSKSIWALIRVSLAQSFFSCLVALTMAIGTAAVLFMGVKHVQTGVLSLGDLLLVNSYLTQLYIPLMNIGDQVTGMQRSLASVERAFCLLGERPDVIERRYSRSVSRATGAVTFYHASFAYDKNHPILEDISFEVTPGTRVGITGKTGAGKTTLLNLLTRFYDPTAGQIFLDGIDLRDYKLAVLRNQFAIALQEPVLFSTSIAENIAYARPDASEQDIITAAQAANAHEFILNLPQGYDTLVGERGMRLSGGQRQRISLARAFLKDAPILILDEPTSSIDTKTEAAIMEAMERLMSNRTTFMIAHRLSTLESCDKLLVLENGRLVTVTSDVSAALRDGLLLGESTTTSHGNQADA
ncbi:MAG TPA: ABC transporter ATP-binding protein [Cyanobacteria bacterium UBA8553]|nr:ABC transporter ATP-binding protein [Cyanobacteria bacterium UBA8553]HAJ60191.1 ABC transporter ATP-binding protein [Cyanobacteria bacterium UBA8543]